MIAASQQGHADAVARLLAQEGVDVNQSNKGGWTPLMNAAQNSHEAVVKQLIAAGAPVGAANGVNGWTALHNASWNQQTSTAKLLVETFHADASATTTADHTADGRTFPAGSTAADVAQAQGHADVVAYFALLRDAKK